MIKLAITKNSYNFTHPNIGKYFGSLDMNYLAIIKFIALTVGSKMTSSQRKTFSL